ncbi:TPA: hypothetical protein H1940_004781 [Salmonella enterica]|nr:hypothetical protein [Salmonella enterica]
MNKATKVYSKILQAELDAVYINGKLMFWIEDIDKAINRKYSRKSHQLRDWKAIIYATYEMAEENLTVVKIQDTAVKCDLRRYGEIFYTEKEKTWRKEEDKFGLRIDKLYVPEKIAIAFAAWHSPVYAVRLYEAYEELSAYIKNLLQPIEYEVEYERINDLIAQGKVAEAADANTKLEQRSAEKGKVGSMLMRERGAKGKEKRRLKAQADEILKDLQISLFE